MGATGSVILSEEAKKPLDASDVNTPRGESAKDEVARLRKLLSENYESVSHLLFANILDSPRKESQQLSELPHVIEQEMFDSAVADLDDSYDDCSKNLISNENAKYTNVVDRPMDRATHQELEALEAELDAEMAREFEDFQGSNLADNENYKEDIAECKEDYDSDDYDFETK